MTKTIINPFETTEKPWYNAYHVRDRKGGTSVWKKIGRAWPHSDLKGLNIQVDTFPLDGRIVIRQPFEKDE